MEVSSHAVSFHRVDGVMFDVAGFTNLTQDHLDLHGSMEEYFQTKAELFTAGARPRARWSPSTTSGAASSRRQPTFRSPPSPPRPGCRQRGRGSGGLDGHRPIAARVSGTDFDLQAPERYRPARAHRPAGQLQCGQRRPRHGHGPGVRRGTTPPRSRPPWTRTIPSPSPFPGRMQLVSTAPAAVVDFAHNPDALARALEAVRSPEPGSRVIVVFGATGQRDQSKRPTMGAIAARLADIVIVSDDDPHDEDAAAIRADVLPEPTRPGTPRAWPATSWRSSRATPPSGGPWTWPSRGHHPGRRAGPRSMAGGQGRQPRPRRQGGAPLRLDSTGIHRFQDQRIES